jgi:hypothetical protein|nr:MAG TPA: hypothetical protein [Caudoviricetes sp.]
MEINTTSQNETGGISMRISGGKAMKTNPKTQEMGVAQRL